MWEIDIQSYLDMHAPQRLYPIIKGLYEALLPAHCHFGYRTIKELLLFVKNAESIKAPNITRLLLDQAIAAKVLPKIRGQHTPELEEALKKSIEICKVYQLSNSSQKLQQMLQRLLNQRYTVLVMIEEYLVLLQVLLQPRTIEVPMGRVSLIQAGKISTKTSKNADAVRFISNTRGDGLLDFKHTLQATNNRRVNQYILWLSMQIAVLCLCCTSAHQNHTASRHMLNPQPASDAAFLVLMGDPNYAALHRLGRVLTCG